MLSPRYVVGEARVLSVLSETLSFLMAGVSSENVRVRVSGIGILIHASRCML